MVNEQVTTLNLEADTPQTIEFSEAYPFYWINNLSDNEAYASLGTPEADTDGTYTISAGTKLRISGGAFNTSLSLLGDGKVQVIASSIASCPFKLRASGAHTDDIICNFPLTEDLNDISGKGATLTYTGDTTLTFKYGGLYLYYSLVTFNDDLLNGVKHFTVDFDVRIDTTGAGKTPQYRRIISAYNTAWTFFEVGYIGATTKNTFSLNTNVTSKTYADSKYHHVSIDYNLSSLTVTAVIDDDETLTCTMSSDSDITSLALGNNLYGLNGYIKNIIIRRTK